MEEESTTPMVCLWKKGKQKQVPGPKKALNLKVEAYFFQAHGLAGWNTEPGELESKTGVSLAVSRRVPNVAGRPWVGCVAHETS